jgi:sugar transferase (PEP-CTERM system associated)
MESGMIRLFKVYYPVQTIALLVCEMLIVSGCFVIATVIVLGGHSYMTLNGSYGGLKIAGTTCLMILCSYYFDLYAPQRIAARWEIFGRLLLALGTLSFILAALIYLFPDFAIAHYVLVLGVTIMTAALVAWRGAYEWIIRRSIFHQKIYVLGSGTSAQTVVETIQSRSDTGMEVIGWPGATIDGKECREHLASALESLSRRRSPIGRVIVAVEDRRGCLPVMELLNLRLAGVVVEDAGSLLERLSGRVQLAGLHPSALIFSEGFRLKVSQQISRRLVSLFVSGAILLPLLPLLPILALLIRLSSEGPILYRQLRVGLRGNVFTIFKFRTMRADAEPAGAVWAQKNDPRVTRLGRFMRLTRLDEIPQLWNVLRGDMGFVGPRPERPEFVERLSKEIAYYDLRHVIRPGLTGWAQVRFRYGATIAESREKLEYDLYYIKHMSLSLDLMIMFETVKTIVLGRGAR